MPAKLKKPPTTLVAEGLLADRDQALRDLMDAVTVLRNTLEPEEMERLPQGIRVRLELALRKARQCTLHAFASWILDQ